MAASKQINAHIATNLLLFILGCVSIPLLVGIGILYYLYQGKRQRTLLISDTEIRIGLQDHAQSLKLSEIAKMEIIEHRAIPKTSDVQITTRDNKQITIKGLIQVEALVEGVNEIIQHFDKELAKKQEVRNSDAEGFAIGGFDRYNDLVGLWQSGMISDEDFEQEKKKFT